MKKMPAPRANAPGADAAVDLQPLLGEADVGAVQERDEVEDHQHRHEPGGGLADAGREVRAVEQRARRAVAGRPGGFHDLPFEVGGCAGGTGQRTSTRADRDEDEADREERDARPRPAGERFTGHAGS
jgi:hypothetical protein